MTGAVVVVCVVLLAYALVERAMRRTPISGAIVFAAIGLLVGVDGLGIITPAHQAHATTLVLEATLVVVLFTDAMAINATAWRRETPLPGRLLAIGFPLSLLAGWAISIGMFPSFGLWDAAVLAAVLVPTDAALGQAVVANPRVPRLIRHGLNVESGLNDGLALPFVVIFLALAQEEDGVVGSGHVLEVFVRALLASGAIGLAIGWAGSRCLRWAIRRGWSGRHWRSIALLAMATLSFVLADAIKGSGFIAVWVAGFTTGFLERKSLAEAAELPEELADLGASMSFLLFGALFLGPAIGAVSWASFGYALLSLTAIRMIPVALALFGSRLARPSVLYLGWFGPRGLASIVFTSLLVEAELPTSEPIVQVVMLTVGLSVLLHGITALWGANRYGDWYEAESAHRPDMPEAGHVPQLHERSRGTGSTSTG